MPCPKGRCQADRVTPHARAVAERLDLSTESRLRAGVRAVRSSAGETASRKVRTIIASRLAQEGRTTRASQQFSRARAAFPKPLRDSPLRSDQPQPPAAIGQRRQHHAAGALGQRQLLILGVHGVFAVLA